MDESKVFGVKPTVDVVEMTKVENYAEFFTLITRGKETRIACGNAIVSRNVFKSVKEAKSYIDSKPWELIINVTVYVSDMLKKTDNKEKTTK